MFRDALDQCFNQFYVVFVFLVSLSGSFFPQELG